MRSQSRGACALPGDAERRYRRCGVRLTVPHYYDFGQDRRLVGDDLVRPDAWDGLRVETDGPFGLARSREQLEEQASGRPEIQARARALDAWLSHAGVSRLASYGVGGALLELWLHRIRAERELILTDYAPRAVQRLAQIFPEAEVLRHDLSTDRPLDADVHLFHRIDTELRDREWRRVLRRFADRRVVVIATEVIDVRRAVSELGMRVRSRHVTRAGWIRTRASFEALWRRSHIATPLRFGDLDGWALEPRG